ncbi:MAG: lytic transglycosylase domain-containing protein [Actinobacteria bacterium]|nr:lytic transglycosylase domain-containing protein [Actinomycetota bacterium]
MESSLRVRARSEAGARGLLQVLPATARELALNPDHPPSNVLAGARSGSCSTASTRPTSPSRHTTPAPRP